MARTARRGAKGGDSKMGRPGKLGSRLHELPEPPAHGFVGRSRELPLLERLLEHQRWGVVLGEGGEGKTELACELARRLVKTGRAAQAVFVSLEGDVHPQTVLAAIGQQLVPGFMAELGNDLETAARLVDRALAARATVIVADAVEGLLAPPAGSPAAALHDAEPLATVFATLQRFAAVGGTRLVITSREPLPAPFEVDPVAIGGLDLGSAVELVARVLTANKARPPRSEGEIDAIALVETVGRHARALVTLAPWVAATGVAATTASLRELMARLRERQKDRPDDERALRERALFASIELAMRHLTAPTRARLARLAIFRGGGHVFMIERVLELDSEKTEAATLAFELVQAGLAHHGGDAYFLFDPALGRHLEGELDAGEQAANQTRWARSCVDLIDFLDRYKEEDAALAARLTARALPNFVACLDHLPAILEPLPLAGLARRLEELVAPHGRRHALARVVQFRETAAAHPDAAAHLQLIAMLEELDDEFDDEFDDELDSRLTG